MADSDEEFEEKLIEAINNKIIWYDGSELRRMQEAYRLHHTCVRNLFEALEKKALISPDPYKKDKKISNIVSPENTEFNENERAMVLGIRFSDYESMLDFICNYMRFSVDQLSIDRIKKLLELNSSFNWSNLSMNSQKPNTRAMAWCITQMKANAVPLTLAVVNDSISKTITALTDINDILKKLASFQKERYKAEIRQNILRNPGFNKAKASSSTGAMLIEIKRMFPACMPKRPFVQDLIAEIIQENIGANKEELRAHLFASLEIKVEKEEKKETGIDTHEVLMDAVRSLGAMSEQYEIVIGKIVDNHNTLQNKHNTFFKRLRILLRKAFGLTQSNVEYDIYLTDKQSGTKRKEKIKYNEFVENLSKRSKYYASLSLKQSSSYAKMNAQKDETILEFLNKQIIENNKMQVVLAALDDHFKNSMPAAERSKMKGIKMELTTLKNSLVKTNQQKTDYTALLEEQSQMKKLGINND